MQELEKLQQFIAMYRAIFPPTESDTDEKEEKVICDSLHSRLYRQIEGHAHGQTQEVFQALALDILRDVGRPMKSTEFIEEFRKRGQPLGGNEVRTA